jgi:hypothetical protein
LGDDDTNQRRGKFSGSVDDWSSESNFGSGRTGVLMAVVNGGCLAEEIALADSVAIGLGSGLVLVDKAWWPARW